MSKRRNRNKNKSVRINDGLTSLAMNLGGRVNNMRFERNWQNMLSVPELDALWLENWIVGKVCAKRSYDMVRRWREISSNDIQADDLEKIERLERVLNIRTVCEQALVWSSLYGGCAILLVTNSPLETPLDSKQELRKLIVLHKDRVSYTGARVTDVMADNFGQYDYYHLAETGQKVHYSRLIIVNGRSKPLSESHTADIWGRSDIEPLYDVLKRYEAISANIGDLVTECKVDVFRMQGLTTALASGQENAIANSMAHIQAIKSATNSLLIDTENDYEQKELAFAGLKDLLVEFRNAVAGAVDMPVTILFGQSASGFASGQEDIQNYHESVHALQESRLRPILERIDPLLCNMAFGGMPEDWWFEFPNLAIPSAEQQINSLNVFAQATGSLIDKGILTEVQVANELKETGLFTNISADDIAELESEEIEPDIIEPEEEIIIEE